MSTRLTWRLIVTLVCLGLAGFAARGATPVETNIFSVSGVEVDITDTDAATAKNKAIIEAQVKGFARLVERLAGAESVGKFAKLTPKDIGRLLRSLSIEDERTGPGRYIGKLTVRFQPNKVRELFGKYGLPMVEEQSPPIVILPVWKTPEGAVIWEDNPWKSAWINLRAEQAVVPVVVPLGDLEDTQAISPEEALANNEVKLESIMIRYGASAILVAIAEPSPEGGVRALMFGQTPLGKVTFDKVYQAEDGTLESALGLAASRFHGVMLEKWRTTRQRIAAEEKARREAERQAALAAAGPQQLSVSVPFSSVVEWNAIRSRLVGAPGVVGVDVASIAGTGAIIKLTYAASISDLQSSLAGRGLQLSQASGTWIIQPF